MVIKIRERTHYRQNVVHQKKFPSSFFLSLSALFNVFVDYINVIIHQIKKGMNENGFHRLSRKA